jgi:calcium-dependent protein kinase
MGCGSFKVLRTKGHSSQVLKSCVFVKRNLADVRSLYDLGEVLGYGSYGHVVSAVHKASRELRSIKLLPLSRLSTRKSLRKLFAEVDILRSLDHPNIVHVYEFFQDDKYLYIVMELCSGGELLDEILQKNSFQESLAAQFMKQLLSAVAYCHSRRIVHRDLKPENLLLSDKTADATLKVIDFGTSVLLDSEQKLRRKQGTVHYLAPEVLTGEYTELCDVWSCGVILYVLLSGKMPFPGSDLEAVEAIVKGEYSLEGIEWDSVSSEAKSLVSQMLQVNPRDRISAQTALDHQWIQHQSSIHLRRGRTITLLDNLATFRAGNKLQRAVMAFMSSQLLSSEEERELAVAFRHLDVSGAGKISKSNLIQASQRAGYSLTESVVEDILSHVDSDQNGFIDHSEFLMAASDRAKLLSKERLEMAFAAFDSDGNGRISSGELRRILEFDEAEADSAWQEILESVDQNGDGEVDLREFKEMMIKYF